MFKNKLVLYITGFLISIALTLAAFFAVVHPEFFHFDSTAVLTAILVLATLQFLTQAIFFLHLGPGSESRWDVAIFASTIILILIIVVGSLWIMNHLNYNMTPQQINQYLMDQSG